MAKRWQNDTTLRKVWPKRWQKDKTIFEPKSDMKGVAVRLNVWLKDGKKIFL